MLKKFREWLDNSSGTEVVEHLAAVVLITGHAAPPMETFEVYNGKM